MSGGLVLALLLGCTAPARYTLASGHEKAPGVQRVLLCPLNVVLALPSEISTGAAPVYQEIEAYLGSLGLEVQTLGLADAGRYWRRAVVEANRSGAQDAAGLLAKDLGERVEFDDGLVLSASKQRGAPGRAQRHGLGEAARSARSRFAMVTSLPPSP